MMTLKFIKYPISLFVSVSLLNSCVQSDYTKLVKSELAKGIRKDSILLGIAFGDTQEKFRNKCFELNRKHLATEGPGFWVQYFFTDSSFHRVPTKISLLFNPLFDRKDVLSGIDLKFGYVGWAPWNRNLQSDSLKIKVKELLTHWYKGNKFVTARVSGNEIPVKVDGNRRILIYEDAPQYVIVKIQDILNPINGVGPDGNKINRDSK